MKRIRVTPAEERALGIAPPVITTPIDGPCNVSKPYPGVMLCSYGSSATKKANLLHPAKAGVTHPTTGCGGYECALKVARTGDFVLIDPPVFTIGKLTVQNALKQVARMCNALDDIGAYWMIIYEDSPLVRQLFSEHNVRYWNIKNSERLVITNYEDTDIPVRP